jgi:DNA-binding beta-propeller fold protein YncE
MRLAHRRALGVALLAIALVPSTAGAAEPNHPLLGTIAGERIGPFEQFKDACGVAVDSKGDVYVADYYQNRVVVFNAKEEYVTQIDGIDPLDAGGVAPIDGPCDLAVDSAGNLYVNDYHCDVIRFAPSVYPPVKETSYARTGTIDANESTGVTVDPKTDDVYVDDRTYVAHYEAPVSAGEEPMEKIGQGALIDAYSVAISRFAGTEGLLYAADAASETVKVFDPALDPDHPQGEIRGEGTQESRFYLTDTDLAVDSADGHLYVANNLEPHFEEKPEAVIDEFSAAGFYRGSVPDGFANGSPSFLQDAEPSALAIGKGDLYVTSGNYEDADVFIFGPPAAAATKFLTVSLAGGGEGSLSSIPAGIACEPVCKAEIKEGTDVVLKATPPAGSVIAGWAGCDETPSPNRCVVEMGSDRSVTAEFEPAPVPALLSSGAAGAAIAAAAAPARPSSVPPPTRSRRGGGPTVVQKGNLRVSLDGDLAPSRLPRTGAAPVGVSLGGEISTTDGSELPQLKKLRIEFNRGGHLETRGLPVCPLSRIQIASSDRALSACQKALVGSGSFHANIVLRGQAPYPTSGRLLIFNGREGGRPVLFGHIYAGKPFATSFVITFRISRLPHGRFGTLLTASLPEALGNWGYVTAIEMKLLRRYTAGGERRSYLSAGCPAPKGFPGALFTLARTSFTFAGGKTLTAALTRSCRVRR